VTDAFVLGGVRTPVGRYSGSLSHLGTDDLLGQTMLAARERVGVPLDRIEDIVAGCVNPAHEGMGDIARWAALAAGFPDSVPAITVNRFCASSLSGAISISHAIRSDELSVGIAAGVESMSRSGWALMKGDAPFSPRGGAVAIGHPFGSSGTRYVLTLATELRLREARYGVLGVCAGSGQGVALVLENPCAA
jgi:acetyl-CoA acetyltransferase